MRVDRVQLDALQVASLPVSLGNKLSSPCITPLFPSIYGKIPANNASNPSQFIYSTNVCRSVCVGLYRCVCVCVCVCELLVHHALVQIMKGVLLFSNGAGQDFRLVLRYSIKLLRETISAVVSND